MNIQLISASRVDEPTLQSLMQLYTHDFSEYWAGTSRGDFLPNGRYTDYPLAEYWENRNWFAYTIRCNDALAGFVLINDGTHSGKPATRNMAEFFVARKFRGQKVGRQAAETAFALHPGLWEVAVARKNVPAQRFWRNLITRVPNALHIEELDINNEHWNGPILRFDNGTGDAVRS